MAQEQHSQRTCSQLQVCICDYGVGIPAYLFTMAGIVQLYGRTIQRLSAHAALQDVLNFQMRSRAVEHSYGLDGASPRCIRVGCPCLRDPIMRVASL